MSAGFFLRTRESSVLEEGANIGLGNGIDVDIVEEDPFAGGGIFGDRVVVTTFR